jgi:hypothetical protein
VVSRIGYSWWGMKSHKATTETDSLAESKSAIEQSIEGLIRATNAYVYMLFVLGAMPWRAGRIANDKTGVITFSATFLFVSSFILSLVLGAAVEFWRLFDFDQLPNIALNEVRLALEPEFAKAIVSLFPGIICAEASARLVARIVTTDSAAREQMRRFVLLAFALDAFILAIVLAVSLAMLESLVGSAIGQAMSAAFGGSHSRSLFEAFLDYWFDYGPFVIPALLIVHFSIVMWFGAQAITPRGSSTAQPSGKRRNPVGRKWRVLLVAHIYLLLLALYVVAISLPHALIGSLKPKVPRHVTMRIESNHPPDTPNVAKITVLVKNNMDRSAVFERSHFALQFESEKDAFLYHTNAAVLDWQAGPAPVMMVPAGATQWVILQADWPTNICASDQLSIHGEWAKVHVETEEAFSERSETFDSEPTMFCALR